MVWFCEVLVETPYLHIFSNITLYCNLAVTRDFVLINRTVEMKIYDMFVKTDSFKYSKTLKPFHKKMFFLAGTQNIQALVKINSFWHSKYFILFLQKCSFT